MKTISKITGTTDKKQNVIALAGITLISALIVAFTFLSITNGIKTF